jgi:F0F1-type ATP synthase alpha subunit
MKKIAGSMKLELAQFREVQAFSQFGSDLDATTQQQLHRGVRLTEMLKQGLNVPLNVEDQILIIFLGVKGFLDQIEVKKISKFETLWLQHIKKNHPHILNEISTKKIISKELDWDLKFLATNFINHVINK